MKNNTYKGNILVVDDMRDNLLLLMKMFIRHGYYVRPVSDGREAISVIRERLPDVILLDIMMPDMDGYTVCKALKADERTRDIPVIFISALNETVDKVKAFSLGGVDFITKPFQEEEVLARVQTHLSLRMARKDLEEKNCRLEKLTEELQRAKETALQAQHAAENANHAKSVFLANMSHELRSPLTAILGFAGVVTQSASLPQEHRENVGIIRRSGEHLLTLINQVLDLSKIEAGRMTLNVGNFDLARLLYDVQDMFALKAERKGLQLVFEQDENVPCLICADEVKLRQALINVLNNAVKFTKEGGIVVRIGTDLCVRPREEQTHESPAVLHFEISDTGPGIAPEEIENVFEAFRQTETGRQAQEGTGLGLPISRKFVRMMGGDMHVKSQVGQGTVLSFDIRAQVVDVAELDSPISSRRVIALEPGQPRHRILIVDDLWNNRQLVAKLLDPFEFELREAVNGQEAIEIWEDWQPHLIWMDMRMPVMDGYEATRRIKSKISDSKTVQKTIIIALTASSFEEERARVLKAGCDDYLRKPFNENQLFDLMSQHIGVRFLYEESRKAQITSQTKGAEDERISEAFSKLPTDLLETLNRGANRADYVLLSNVIEQIQAHNAALGDALARLAEDFDYDGILALIQRNCAESEKEK